MALGREGEGDRVKEVSGGLRVFNALLLALRRAKGEAEGPERRSTSSPLPPSLRPKLQLPSGLSNALLATATLPRFPFSLPLPQD